MAQDWQEQWQGNLFLRFDRVGSCTRLLEKAVSMPLAFQKVLYPEGSAVAHGVILHPPGGLAKGDCLSMRVELGSAAEVVLTTPGAGKFYASTRGATQQVNLSVGQCAHLDWVPQESILFDGAQMQSTTRIELAEEATWMGWDIWRFGRSGAGETFLQGHWRSATEVWRGGQPLWMDRQAVTGGSPLLQSPFGLRGYPVMATFAWIGDAINEELLQLCKSISLSGDSTRWAVGRVAHGLVARYLGPSTAEARRRFVLLWDILRRGLRQRAPCLPRVWNT